MTIFTKDWATILFLVVILVFWPGFEGHVFAQTIAEYQESDGIRQAKTRLVEKASEGDRGAEMELVGLYIASYQLSERLKAVPILEDLASKGDANAIGAFALESFNGTFGESTMSVATEYRNVLEDQSPSTWSTISASDNHYQTAFKNFDRAKELYEDSFPFCEQRGNYSDNLTEQDSYLSLMYINHCLRKYSVMSNSAERLSALSRLEEYACELRVTPDGEEKVCLHPGFAILGAGEFENVTEEEMLSAAYATEIYSRHHWRELAPFISRDVDAPPVGKKLFREIQKAQKDIGKNRLEDALDRLNKLLERAESDSKFSDYERAAIRNFCGFVEYKLGRFDDTISTYEGILRIRAGGDENLLWQTRRTLLQLYVMQHRSREALQHFASIVEQSPSEIELIPRSSLEAIQALRE